MRNHTNLASHGALKCLVAEFVRLIYFCECQTVIFCNVSLSAPSARETCSKANACETFCLCVFFLCHKEETLLGCVSGFKLFFFYYLKVQDWNQKKKKTTPDNSHLMANKFQLFTVNYVTDVWPLSVQYTDRELRYLQVATGNKINK